MYIHIMEYIDLNWISSTYMFEPSQINKAIVKGLIQYTNNMRADN